LHPGNVEENPDEL